MIKSTDSLHVLHVDDEEGFLFLTKQYLENLDDKLNIESITCPEDALSKLDEKHFDVIVSDYQMHPIDGLEFLKKLRNQHNNIPFIIFTGRGREEVAIQALNLGADYYLKKGGKQKVNLENLIISFRRLLSIKIQKKH
ncbi:MAG: response regulator [Candidatus Hodarchaeales archaeon]|jgi:CheY-like chemotaxis protein